MLFDYIVNYCNAEYSAADTEHICDDCQHQNCQGSCKECLEEIHYPAKYPDGKKDYDCNNLMNFYVCDYSFKYASEIWYLLRKSSLLSELKKINMLSIGCGAAPDLMAMESYLAENNFGDKQVCYHGIDNNSLWMPIHQKITEYRSPFIQEAKFCYNDAIHVIESTPIPNANVLVLQYFISHLYINKQIDQLRSLYDSIIENIVLRRNSETPFIIIINDVNSCNRGRDSFEELVHKLESANIHGTYSKYYFDHNIKNEHQRYGLLHPNKRILYGPISAQFIKYQPWEFCSSAQLLIEINKEKTNDYQR